MTTLRKWICAADDQAAAVVAITALAAVVLQLPGHLIASAVFVAWLAVIIIRRIEIMTRPAADPDPLFESTPALQRQPRQHRKGAA